MYLTSLILDPKLLITLKSYPSVSIFNISTYLIFFLSKKLLNGFILTLTGEKKEYFLLKNSKSLVFFL